MSVLAVGPAAHATASVHVAPAGPASLPATEPPLPALSARYRESIVLLPPLVCFLACAALGAGTARLAGGSAAAVLHLVLLSALLQTTVAAARAVTAGLGREDLARGIAVPGAAIAAFGLDAVLPGPASPAASLLVVALLAAVTPLAVRAWRARLERSQGREVTLVLGRALDAPAVLARLLRIRGLRVSSLLVPGSDVRRTPTVQGIPMRTRIVRGLSKDRRAVVCCPGRNPHVEAAVAQLVARGYEVESESSVLRAAEGRVDSDLASPLSLLLGRPRACREWVYRLRDVLVAAPMLILLLPVFLLVAIVVRLDSKGPAFFSQRRVGARGRPFRLLKFRTMRLNAEAATGPMWAVRSDPRVTRAGTWLRRTRLDELPQLINVLLGQMSLVGPRPERAHFVRKLRADIPLFELRSALRPGLTGWAQVRGSYASDVEETRAKLERDLYYLSRRSLLFDLAILAETFTVALSGQGAR